MKLKMSILLFILILSACEQSDVSTEQSLKKSLTTDTNTINNSDYTIRKIDNTDKINLKLYNNPRDIYLLFTNPNSTSQEIVLNKNHKQNFQSKIEHIVEEEFPTQHAPKYIMNFNHSSIKKSQSQKKLSRKEYQKQDSIDNKQLFYLEKDLSISTQATAKKIIKNIKTKYGNKINTLQRK